MNVLYQQKRHIVVSVAAGYSHAIALALETKPHSLPSQMVNRWQTVSHAHTGLGEYTSYIVLYIYMLAHTSNACKCNWCAIFCTDTA
jgi:hypothetical protein